MKKLLLLLCLSSILFGCSLEINDKELLAEIYIPEGRMGGISCVVKVFSEGYVSVTLGGSSSGLTIEQAEYQKAIKISTRNREKVEALIEKVKSESLPTKNFEGLREGGIEVFLTIGENVYRYLYDYHYDTDNLRNVDVKALTDTVMEFLPKKVRKMYYFD